MKWTCKDGRILEVNEMSDEHLKNTIAMLRRQGAVTSSEFASCASYVCSAFAGEMATDAAEAELMRMQPSRALEALENELANRGKLISE